MDLKSQGVFFYIWNLGIRTRVYDHGISRCFAKNHEVLHDVIPRFCTAWFRFKTWPKTMRTGVAESVESLVAPALDGDTFLIAGMREDLLPTIQDNVTRHEAASFLYVWGKDLAAQWLINYIDTKAKCRHLKNCPLKGLCGSVYQNL